MYEAMQRKHKSKVKCTQKVCMVLYNIMHVKPHSSYFVYILPCFYAYRIANYAINDRGTQKVVCAFFVLGCFINH